MLYENCAYLADWPGVPIGDEEGPITSEGLGDKEAILLAHHGILTACATLEKATVLAFYLERAACCARLRNAWIETALARALSTFGCTVSPIGASSHPSGAGRQPAGWTQTNDNDSRRIWMRTKISHGLVVAALLTCGSASATVVIEGVVDCRDWTEGRANHTAGNLEHYVLGLLNGLTLGRDREFWRSGGKKISPQQAYLWMDDYCRANPANQVMTGARELFRQRTESDPPSGNKTR